MLAFWLPAAILTALAALCVLQRGAAAARRAARADEAPEIEVHRRQLADLEAQARRGLIGESEHAAARAEAARRLLATAGRERAPETPGGRGARVAALAVAVLAALAALGLYLSLGSPGRPDEPYARRLAQWRRADPAALDPARMAAVLAAIAETRPRDPQVFDYLGRAQMAAGAPGEAARAFARAARLAPAEADLPAEEGEALVMGAGGKVEPPAEAAFREALRRDPRNAAARFHLARLRMSRGDVAGGLADWRALEADLPADDPRRAALAGEIAQASASPAPAGGPTDAAVAAAAAAIPAPGPEQAAFIRGMVDRLAARLKAQPDDPDGWARLVRAYRVLGDGPAQAQALARARQLFAGRPAVLARIEAER